MQTEDRQFVGFGIFTPNMTGNPFDEGELIAKNATANSWRFQSRHGG